MPLLLYFFEAGNLVSLMVIFVYIFFSYGYCIPGFVFTLSNFRGKTL